MDANSILEEAKARRAEIVQRINQLEDDRQRIMQEKQQLIQEALRLDGEVRALEKLKAESEGG